MTSLIRFQCRRIGRLAITCSLALYPLGIAAARGNSSAGPIESAAQGSTDPVESSTLTFNRDVAPIVFSSCSSCHRPGEAAPFSLLSYRDVAKRSQQIARITASRFMPPWLPAPGDLPFANDRSLSADEIDVFQRWAAAGAPEGDPIDLPSAPTWKDGWVLGEPDLIVKMPRSFRVPAEGRDVYRNFVIPAPVDTTRYVRAVEFQPDNRVVLHHLVLSVDGSGEARARERAAQDGGTGYPDMGIMRRPDGQFLGWIPGKVPQPGSSDVSWRIDSYTDIVLQLHLRPSGKPEDIQVSLGLYFADEPPTTLPLAVNIWSRDIRIPAGEDDYRVAASYVLPVDVEIQGVWPHAHYLGKDLTGYAILPDGERRTLIHIPSWDFNWQEEYFYAEPFRLPAGTRIGFDYQFDNSAENPFNPNSPPARVVYGPMSANEMAELVFVCVAAPDDRPLLFNDYRSFAAEQSLNLFTRFAERQSWRPRWLHELGQAYAKGRRYEEAIAAYEDLLELRPGGAGPLTILAKVRLDKGDVNAAIRDLTSALQSKPDHVEALVTMARARAMNGNREATLRYLERVLERKPAHEQGRTLLGIFHMQDGESTKARALFEEVLIQNPESTATLVALAELEYMVGNMEAALWRTEEALHIQPDEARGLMLLARLREDAGDLERAKRLLKLSLRISPGNSDARARLDRLQR